MISPSKEIIDWSMVIYRVVAGISTAVLAWIAWNLRQDIKTIASSLKG